MSPQRCKANLEDVWRLRLEQAAKRHKNAKANCLKQLEEFKGGIAGPSDGFPAVRQAILEETDAREEHLRVLEIFTDLIVRRKIPREES